MSLECVDGQKEDQTDHLPRLFIGFSSSAEKVELSPRSKEKKAKGIIVKQILGLESGEHVKAKIEKKMLKCQNMSHGVKKKYLSMLMCETIPGDDFDYDE